MRLPPSRGPLSAAVNDALRAEPRPVPALAALVDGPAGGVSAGIDPCADGDAQLALAVLYELHYRGFDDVDDRWEWEASLLAARGSLERRFEEALRAAVPAPDRSGDASGDQRGDIAADLRRLVAADDGPSLSAYLLRHAGLPEFRDFVRQRSVYHLREADSHTWGIPRLAGVAKAALVEIQSDEYGRGDAARMHAALFARTMRALDLDDSYGAWWPAARPETLAVVNLMSLFGLHRRLRGALAGHLAAFEMTSTTPNRRYGNGLRRLGFRSEEALEFFDEHVEADAVHEQLAAVDLCGGLVRAEPRLYADVLWGAACALHLEAAFGRALLGSWAGGVAGAADPGDDAPADRWLTPA